MNIEQLYSLYLRCQRVSIDTRQDLMKAMFFGLKGANFNGNQYAQQAIDSGALFAIVDEKEYADESKDIYYVEDSLNALQKLAMYHRQQLKIPIIALTGSNGKTTTKELITTVLSKKYKVASTVGNLNNHIGVPLTLLSIHPNHEIAVVEMGANHLLEIEFLTKIIQPDFGYITNFGKAHLEGFGGVEGVVKGKSELYDYLRENKKQAFVNCHDPKQMELTQDIKRITFGNCPNADYSFFYDENLTGNCPAIVYENHFIQSHLVGEYNVNNVAAAMAIGLTFDIEIEDIKEAIESYQSSNNRSQIVDTKNHRIILDAYNANPSSMEAALCNFAKIQGDKAVILGDMFELGENSAVEHHHIAKMACQMGFNQVILIGKNFRKVNLEESDELRIFESKELATKYLKKHPITEKNLLIKGSRGMALENLIELFDY